MDDAAKLARQLALCSEEERVELVNTIQEREAQLRILNDFAVSLIQIASLEDLYWYVAKEVVARLGFVDCVLYELDAEKQVLVQRAAIGAKNPEGREIVNRLDIPIGTGITGRVAQRRKAEIVNDLLADADYVLDVEQGRSEICVPLLNGEELLGVIDCEDPRPNYFTREHLETLHAVAALTSSKVAECRAVQQIQNQSQILETVRESITLIDRDGRIIDCNQGTSAIYGYSRAELLNKHASFLYATEEAWDKISEQQWQQLSTKGSWRGNIPVKSKADGVLTMDVSLTGLYDQDGEYMSTIAVARDITQLVKTEHEIREKNKALEAKQKELEKALAEGEEARRVNRAKDTFLANTSHELRTPLTGVIGTIDLLQETDLTSEQQALMAAANTSARTLLTIIDDVLDLAKIESGKITLREDPFDAVGTVRSVAEALRQSAEQKGLDFKVQLPEKAASVLGDASRLRQILFNVIGNAVKFTQEGSVTITVTAEECGTNCGLCVSVADTGVGFSEAAQKKLFGRFEQLDASATKAQGGTGLGLAISRELAELMGGTLTATGEEGIGATFVLKVEFPLNVAANPDATVSLHSVGNVSDKPLRILVAEDNSINQLLVTKMLEKFPWEILIVENGCEAVDQLESGGAFDLVLMDIRMPVMDGIEATRLVRSADKAYAQIPIIALTANTMDSDRKQYLDAGMNAVVGKPIDLSELLAAIEAFAG